jgi:hypothetical protein
MRPETYVGILIGLLGFVLFATNVSLWGAIGLFLLLWGNNLCESRHYQPEDKQHG